MHWILVGLNLAVNIVVTLLALSVCFAIYRLLARGTYTPQGDISLARSLGQHTGRWSSRRVAAAWIDLDARTPTRTAFLGCDEATAFEIGSLTKPLTGLLVHDAIERGELTLDTPLHELDERLGAPLGERTMRHLVTHTSGLPRLPRSLVLRSMPASLFALNPYPRSGPDIIAAAAKQKIESETYRYSNLGGALAGQLVARRAGANYHALLRERLLDPLGMAATSTDPRQHRVKRGWTSAGRHAMPWRMDGYAPAGGAVSTIADMALLATALLDGSAPGRRAMAALPGATTDVADVEQATFFQVRTVAETGRRMVCHNGQTGGYSAFLGVFPEARRAIVVLSDTAVAAITTRTALALVGDMVAEDAGTRQTGHGRRGNGNKDNGNKGNGNGGHGNRGTATQRRSRGSHAR